jgi:hypothetical protein
VVGRLDPGEASRPEYGFLPPAHRQRATIAKPGTMFVMQPEIPVPLVCEFPFPAWATRPDEQAGVVGASPDHDVLLDGPRVDGAGSPAGAHQHTMSEADDPFVLLPERTV